MAVYLSWFVTVSISYDSNSLQNEIINLKSVN